MVKVLLHGEGRICVMLDRNRNPVPGGLDAKVETSGAREQGDCQGPVRHVRQDVTALRQEPVQRTGKGARQICRWPVSRLLAGWLGGTCLFVTVHFRRARGRRPGRDPVDLHVCLVATYASRTVPLPAESALALLS